MLKNYDLDSNKNLDGAEEFWYKGKDFKVDVLSEFLDDFAREY